MDSLLDYLDAIEELLDNSKTVPFSNKISVEKERIYDIVTDIRMNLPVEIRQAQRIIEDHDIIINDAKAKAENIVRDSESEAKNMVSGHEIFKRANEQATEFLEETKQNAREMKLGAVDYADDILQKSEAMIREAMENIEQQYKYMMDYFGETIEVLYENRQQLRGGAK